MKRVMFVLGAGVGFVLGARAGRTRYEQIKTTAIAAYSAEPTQQAIAVAQRGTDAASDQLARLGGKVSASSRELPGRLVHTAESLRDDLRRRAEDFSTNIGDARDTAIEWVDTQKERSLEKQTENFLAIGDLRSEALASVDTESDEMVDDGRADERNLSEER